MSFSSGDYEAQPASNALELVAQKPRDITFSLALKDEYGSRALVDAGLLIEGVTELFEESGSFSSVRYVTVNEPSANHYHFDVTMSGTGVQTRFVSSILSCAFMFLVPTWKSFTLDWSMSAYPEDAFYYTLQDQQRCTDVIWFPFVLGMPFYHQPKAQRALVEEPLRYFLSEMQMRQSLVAPRP